MPLFTHEWIKRLRRFKLAHNRTGYYTVTIEYATAEGDHLKDHVDYLCLYIGTNKYFAHALKEYLAEIHRSYFAKPNRNSDRITLNNNHYRIVRDNYFHAYHYRRPIDDEDWVYDFTLTDKDDLISIREAMFCASGQLRLLRDNGIDLVFPKPDTLPKLYDLRTLHETLVNYKALTDRCPALYTNERGVPL